MTLPSADNRASLNQRALRRVGAPLCLAAALGLAAGTLPRTSRAQPSGSVRDEARERFDRGLRLFNQQDNEGALAEFTRAYELVPHALLLYNIGLVYAAMGRPVLAVATLDKVLASPSGLDADKLARARAERSLQEASIAEVEVLTPVAGASVEVDGVEAGTTPLQRPLRVAAGLRVIGVIAPGYAPLRKSVTVAGKTRTQLEFSLVLQEAQLSHLEVRTRIPDVHVYVDGAFVGQTPLASSLSLTPGQRLIELRRPGYLPASRKLLLGAGSSGALELPLQPDPQALRTHGGTLALSISESEAVVLVDGESKGAYGAPLRLAPGAHTLRVERAEFFPFERKVLVPQGGHTSVHVELEPTPEKRASYRSAAQARRTWGWVSIGAGSLFALGGGGFLIWNAGKKNDHERQFAAEAAKNEPGQGGECDPARGDQTETCVVALEIALSNLESARDRDAYGWVGIGVGAAALGTGVFLLLSGNDPDRYEPKPESDVFGRLRLRPQAYIGRRGESGAFAVSGSF